MKEGGVMNDKAAESKQVQKAREKLKHQLQEEQKLVTEEALRKGSEEIKSWITRHQKERIKLRGKDVSLFDENKHPAKLHSRYIKHLIEDLAKPVPPNAERNLSGRVTKGF